jgi:hypothetical protein
MANPFDGTFTKLHKPTLKPSFAKEPPSQRTQTAVKWTDNNTSEKKGST